MNYSLHGNQIRDGGEGIIFKVQGRSDILMKIYKEKNPQDCPIFTPELQQKLKFMIDNPPESLISQRIIAWPLEFVTKHRKVIGFVMPKLTFNASIQKICAYKHPIIDKKNYNDLPAVKSRIGIAINLSSMLSELHRTGYIVGDFNHENIGVNKSNAQINIVDCDSFHIIDRNGKTMRTNVVMEGYLAPEIIAHCNNERARGRPYELDKVALPTFSKYSDLFCLSVHIFKLLMNGVHPFLGVNENAAGSKAAPFVGHEGVERNNYVFKSGLRPAAAFCLDKTEIPPQIASMFDKTFTGGHTDPSKRAAPEEWYNVLKDYMGNLKQCKSDPKHQYYNKLKYCPYCEADKRHTAAQGQVMPGRTRAKPKTVQTNTAPQNINPVPINTAPQTYLPSKSAWRTWWKRLAKIAAAAIIVIWLFYPKPETSKLKDTPPVENSAKATLNSESKMSAADYNKRGDSYYYKRQYNLAIEDFSKAISLNNNYTEAYYNRGWAYFDTNKYQKALDDFNKTIALDSKYVKAYNGRGRTYEKLGNLNKALEDFDKAISLNKNYVDAKYNRDRIYKQLHPGPTNLKVLDTGTDSVSLIWDSAGDDVTYNIYWGSEKKNASVPNVTIYGPSAWVTGMSAGTVYFFGVSSVRNGNESAKSGVRVQTLAR